MTTLNATSSFKIPQLSAELPDPTSYHCPVLDGLKGNERIVAAYKLVCQQKDFYAETEPTATDPGPAGTILLTLPVEKQSVFWSFCFENGYTLADLNKGIKYNGATYTFAAEELTADEGPEEVDCSKEEYLRFEQLSENSPELLLIQSNGTVIIKD